MTNKMMWYIVIIIIIVIIISRACSILSMTKFSITNGKWRRGKGK